MADAQYVMAHEIFTALLEDYVRDGHVNYEALCEDNRLQTYVDELAAVDPVRITDENERLAFWINAYNAFTLKIICDNYPIESINDLHFGGLVVGTVLKKTVWDKDFIVINDEEYSLNDIEHKIIRKEFDDPRAHFALVCASKSCPRLRTEAFTGATLDAQLDDQAQTFFADTDKNYFEMDRKRAYLSKILDWYSKDFGSNNEEILLFVAQYVEDDVAESIRANPKEWDVKHTEYDWILND